MAKSDDDTALFQSIAESIPGYIFRYRRNPDGSEGLDYVSPGIKTIWEPIEGEDIGDPAKHWTRIVPEDLPVLSKSIETAIARGGDWDVRYRILMRDKTVKWLHGRGKVVAHDDGTIIGDGMIVDVTEQVATETQLRATMMQLGQAQKMEAIGRIAGGISHDFNNLLAIISGNADLIGEMDEGETPETYAAEIVQACQRGGELTRRLLSFARQAKLEPEVTDVNAVISQICTMFARIIPARIKVDTILTAGVWQVEIDPNFLESSLLNLCINARDAMPDGGRLTIETSNIRISSDYVEERAEEIEPGRYVMVAVSDNGVGIPRDELSKVIEPFYSTKGPNEGSGLGLAMVDGFVRQSKGAMRIYSEVGVGTTFKIYLPVANSEAIDLLRARQQPPMPVAGTSQARLLVVEDEPAILTLLERMLTAAGYDVLTATSGDIALAQYQEAIADIDVLLTDVVVPGSVQGPVLAQRLSAFNPELKVVFMSGYPNEAAVNGNGLRPDDRFLMKPVLRKDLLNTIAAAVAETEKG